MSEHRLIVGLGNPEKKYEFTRHNLGFLVTGQLAKVLNCEFKKSSLTKGFIAEGQQNGIDISLLQPLTYMNKSGIAVKQIVHKKEILLENILIVCDDLNLDFGALRLRSRGSDGGHNGLSSVIELLGSDEFSRLRLGIGQPPASADSTDFVLEEFKGNEKSELNSFIDRAGECCLSWVSDGIERTMDKFNKR